MSGRRRAGGRAPLVIGPWTWVLAATACASLACAAAVREVPALGVGACLAAALGCAFAAGRAEREQR